MPGCTSHVTRHTSHVTRHTSHVAIRTANVQPPSASHTAQPLARRPMRRACEVHRAFGLRSLLRLDASQTSMVARSVGSRARLSRKNALKNIDAVRKRRCVKP
nr:hypothetical protein [Burkholderia pseudomallei]